MNASERAARIASYGNAYQVLTSAIQKFPREMWQWHAAHDPWTIHDVIVHITDSEANSFIRCRRAIAEPGSAVLGYDEMRWVQGLSYAEQDPDDALELFKWLRGNTYKLIKRLPASTWSNTIEHSENGPMTLDEWLDVYERHIPEHLEQMQRIYAAWQSARR